MKPKKPKPKPKPRPKKKKYKTALDRACGLPDAETQAWLEANVLPE